MKIKNREEKDLRILLVNYEFPPLGGGGGVSTYDLGVEWAKNARVDVLTSSFKEIKKFEVVENINIYRVRILFRKSRDAATFISMLTYIPGAFFKGIKLIRKNRYHVINTHFAVPSGPVGYMLGRIFRIPNVLSLHGGDIYDPSKKMSPHRSFFWRAIVKFMLNRADRLVAQSSNTKSNAVKYYSPKKNITIVPLAFHPVEIQAVTRKMLSINEEDFILITIGRIIKRKAIDVIINALSGISNEKIKLLVIGDGPERENLENMANRLDLANRVNFLGTLSNEDKYKYLSMADLFILTSLHEGFGIVFMEAMHCGLPIVCTNHGGQTDFLNNEENGILFEVGDVESCAEAILRFYKDKNLYKKCSGNNLIKIKEFYAEDIAKRYIDIFKDAASGDGCAK